LTFSLLVKWQPWECRLLLPLALLWCVFLAQVLDTARARWVTAAIAAVFFVSSFYFLLNNLTRPWLGEDSIFRKSRMDQYFASDPDFEADYAAAAGFLRTGGFRNVGLAFWDNDWEYPLWIFLGKDAARQVRIEHIDVENESGRITQKPFRPEAILCSLQFARHRAADVRRYLRLYGPPKVFRRLFVFLVR
jgi:hypothetical protein